MQNTPPTSILTFFPSSWSLPFLWPLFLSILRFPLPLQLFSFSLLRQRYQLIFLAKLHGQFSGRSRFWLSCLKTYQNHRHSCHNGRMNAQQCISNVPHLSTFECAPHINYPNESLIWLQRYRILLFSSTVKDVRIRFHRNHHYWSYSLK